MRYVNDDILRVAAFTLGGKTQRFAQTTRWMLYEFNGISFPCHGMRMPFDEPVSIERANNKLLSRSLLGQAVPVIAWELVDTENPPQIFSQGEWVLKPIAGMKGLSVVTRLQTHELGKYFDLFSTHDRYAFLEPYIMSSFVLRIIVLDGNVIGAYTTMAPVIRGDGYHSVEQLIAFAPDALPLMAKRLVPVDMESIHALSSQGMQLASIPADGVLLNPTYTINISRGASWARVDAQASYPACVGIAKKAASIVGLRLAGIDIIITETGDPMVLEANPSPGILGQTFDPVDKVIDLRAAQAIVRTAVKYFGVDIMHQPDIEQLSVEEFQDVLSDIESAAYTKQQTC